MDMLLDVGNQDRFKETLRFLDGYIAKHFSDEQKMHTDTKYPKAAAHRGYHEKFTESFNKLKTNFEKQGHTATNNIELHKATAGWLRDHILVHDKEFAEYHKTQGG